MANKVIFALAVALALQVVYSLEAITPETRQKLQVALRDAVHAKRQSAIEINVITRVIEKNIYTAVHPIEEAVRALKDSVDNAKKQAEIEKKDISDCVQQVRDAVHKLDKDAVRNCKRIPEAVKANTEMRLIEKEIGRIHNLEHICSTNADQDKCVLDAIADSSKNIAAHQAQITSIMKNAKPEEADDCIKTNAAKLESDVKKITGDWEDCLKKH